MPTTILSVPGLSGDHCRETIHKTLDRVASGHIVSFDMHHRRISIDTDRPLPAEVLMSALADAGYPAYLAEEGRPIGISDSPTPGDPADLYGGPHPTALTDEANPAGLYGGAQATHEPEYASPASLYGGGPPATDLQAEAAGEGLSWDNADSAA